METQQPKPSNQKPAPKQPAGPTALTVATAPTLIQKAHDRFLTMAKSNPGALQLNWDREASFASQIILKSPQLPKAAPDSIVNAITNVAAVGLTLNPIKQHCTIVPRYNVSIQGYEAALMVMVRGFIYLATQAGVTDIVADVVYHTDQFDIWHSDEGDGFKHAIDVRTVRGTDTNPFVGAFVCAVMPGSKRRKVEWVPAADIYKMRAQSDAAYLWENSRKTDKLNPNAGWAKWFDEYAKKGAIKRASKRWEEAMHDDSKWTRFQTAVELDNRAEGRTYDAEVIPLEPKPKLSMKEIAEIEGLVEKLEIANPQRYMAIICQAYGVGALSEIDADKMPEILERVKAGKEEAVKQAAKKKPKESK